MNKSIAQHYDVETEESSHAKGKQLEEEFSVLMKKKLGWDNTRVGVHLAGRDNRKGASVDIVGHRLDAKGKMFRKAFKVYTITFVLLMVIGVFYGLAETFNDGVFSSLFITGILFEIAGAVTIYFSNAYNKENVLVECKNIKAKVNVNMIYKTLREIDDYNESQDKEYKFKYHYFVSANGYIENALKYANEHGIICFEKQNGKFIESQYWQ